jgi:adhesin transport system membrane fusion protein
LNQHFDAAGMDAMRPAGDPPPAAAGPSRRRRATLWSRIAAVRGPRRMIGVIGAGFVIFVVWAAFAKLEEVTRGQGQVIPSSKSQIIQAAEPSTVKAIMVRSGQTVKAGQLLVRLDDTQSSAELGQIQAENRTMTARASRLGNEAEGEHFDCPQDVVNTMPDACINEQKLQQLRQQALGEKRSALSAQIEQKRRDMGEAQATAASLQTSLALAKKQVDMIAPLAARNIVPQTELYTAQREVSDLTGRLGAAQESSGRAQAAIREAQAQEQESVLHFRQDAMDEANQLNAKLAALSESQRGAAGKLERSEIRAPMNGVVSNVQVATIGGFVNAGQKLMEVVPMGDKLLVETRVQPKDIAFIQVGQDALVKVTAYDFSIYGGLPGKVVQVSADSIYDEATKSAYFSVIIETDRAYLKSGDKQLPITPGMICNADIVTGRKSVLAYLLKPVLKAHEEALRER